MNRRAASAFASSVNLGMGRGYGFSETRIEDDANFGEEWAHTEVRPPGESEIFENPSHLSFRYFLSQIGLGGLTIAGCLPHIRNFLTAPKSQLCYSRLIQMPLTCCHQAQELLCRGPCHWCMDTAGFR